MVEPSPSALRWPRPLTDVDTRVLYGSLVSHLYKFLGRRAYCFEHGRIVAKISAEEAMQMVDLRPLSETSRVRRQLCLRKQLFRERAALTVLGGIGGTL